MIADAIRKILPANVRPIKYLSNKTFARTGGRVHAGPFKRMKYSGESYGSCYIPKLLGIYERELNDAVEEACALGTSLIVDIGAAEGYYAVGMALRNPRARVVAFEMEEIGRKYLQETIRINAVQNAVEVRGKCEVENLAGLLKPELNPVVICDCEGYEQVLLDPARVPGLTRSHVLVELHDFIIPGLAEQLEKRFAPTHQVSRIWQEPREPKDYPFDYLYLRLLPESYHRWVVSEWRPEKMSWLWMRPKAGQSA
jgi:hypothetical protein